MVVDHARWIYDGFGDLNQNRTGLEILGDSVINNISYKKVFRLSINDGAPNSLIEIESKSLVGFVREDLSDKKVYCLIFNELPQITFSEQTCLSEISNGEFLLYDFDLIVGDTLNTCLARQTEPSIDTIFVVSISPEIYNTYTLNTYGLNFDLELIEGIGYKEGLFQHSNPAISAAKGFFLSLYCREENINDCLSSNNSNLEWNELSIFPNPSSSVINLSSSEPFTELYIYNLLGKEYFSKQLGSTLNYKLDISRWASGVYIVKIGNDKREYVLKKIIKK
jgi:hypothetical protein